jgi:thiaminase
LSGRPRTGIGLSVSPAAATTAYLAMLDRLETAAPAGALAALWAIERVYLDAWRAAAPGALAYRTFVAHWTTVEFACYVDELSAAADLVLAAADPPLDPIGVVSEILDLEVRFWDAATGPVP